MTEGGNKGARDALKKSVKKGVPGATLATCWIVFAPEGQASMKTFLQRVQPALVELERSGETFFERERAGLPPFGRLAGIIVSAATRQEAESHR